MGQAFAKRKERRLIEHDFFLAIVDVELGFPCRVRRVGSDHALVLREDECVVGSDRDALRVHGVHRTAGGVLGARFKT